MATPKETIPVGQFEVRVENPQAIYYLVNNNLPFVHQWNSEDSGLNPPANLRVLESLSQTVLDGDLFAGETTVIGITKPSSSRIPHFVLLSNLALGEANPDRNPFYSERRVDDVQRHLQEREVDVHKFSTGGIHVLLTDWLNRRSLLQVNFGFADLEEYKAYVSVAGEHSVEDILERQANTLGLYSHIPGIVTLKYESTFIDQPEFGQDLLSYVQMYEQTIRSLYAEQKATLPSTPIVLSSPYSLSRPLNLEL